jgi:hypothetical protein
MGSIEKGIEIWKTLCVSAHFNASDAAITTVKPVAFLYKNVVQQSGVRHVSSTEWKNQYRRLNL